MIQTQITNEDLYVIIDQSHTLNLPQNHEDKDFWIQQVPFLNSDQKSSLHKILKTEIDKIQELEQKFSNCFEENMKNYWKNY